MPQSTHEFILYLGNGTGLTMLDVLLLTLCPVATMIGTMVSNAVSKIINKPEFVPATEVPPHMLVRMGELDASVEQKNLLLAKYNAEREEWFMHSMAIERRADSIRLPFVGFVLGLVIALYFVGAITENITSLARILGLCVLLGYQAPSLWITQEAAIKKLVDKKVSALLSK